MKKARINIAIDGPSASGKSTIAKRVALKLDYIYVDTGAMYRCLALKVVRKGIDEDDVTAIAQLLKNTQIVMSSEMRFLMDNEDVSASIRSSSISLLTSKISTYAPVRAIMVAYQQRYILNKGCVMDGRDIGTVVMPDAELKIFQVASVQTRAERRFQQQLPTNPSLKFSDVLLDLQQRDYQDIHREASPLRKADDAIEIDTSDMTIDEVVQQIIQLAIERMN